MRQRLVFTALSAVGVVAAALFARWYYYPEVRADAQGAPDFAVNQAPHAARGFGTDSARVDSQITLRIPDGQADAVYQYLKGKYVGRDHILAAQFPDLHLSGQAMSDVSVFTDRYYDTPTLDLYKGRNSARHRQRVNTNDAEDRKSGRELVQMKVTPPGQFKQRTELKYEVKPAKQRKRKSADDRHPLIRLIAPEQREDFKQVYHDAGIDPYSLRHVITIKQTRSRGYLNWDQQNICSFSVDQGSGRLLWAEGRFSSVDLGLVEIAYTEADAQKRQVMWQIRAAVIKDLEQQFPGLSENSDSKYSIVLEQLMQQIRLIPAMVRFRLL